MKNFRREGKVGEWAIYYWNPPYPGGFGRIKEVREEYYYLEVSFPLEIWDKNYCATFETEEEAKKEYYEFVKNKNNYALEG